LAPSSAVILPSWIIRNIRIRSSVVAIGTS
jgi:hypothetical protein